MSKWLVTGGAGFIGTNLVLRLLLDGNEVIVIDDLSREGSIQNWALLQMQSNCDLHRLDVADQASIYGLLSSISDLDYIVHLAGQVSLLHSIEDPLADFASNAAGTIYLLEAVRKHHPSSRLIFSSTNKVYGDLSDQRIVETATKYEATDFPYGMPTNLKLDFHGGYGCSKGAADQYVLDYNRIFDLDTVVFRQSAICGKFQHPKADQGWASFLVKETLARRQINLNGRGLQVRDLLDVEDLVDLIITVMQSKNLKSRVYNVGGGVERSLSLMELFTELESRGFHPSYSFGKERPSDQKVFVADIRPLLLDFKWRPMFSLQQIIDRLIKEESKLAGDQH
jgi:CDP-paratose 2-epimerase